MNGDRIIIERSERGHVVAMGPRLVLRARLAIRQRRDGECEVRKAA